MGSMNQWEVEEARDLIAQLTEVPRLQLASRMMVRLVGWVNSNSDGWPYWALPSKASSLLQDKLSSVRAEYIRGEVVDLTQAQLTSLIKPIRSFLTNRDADPDKVLNDPPPPPPVDVDSELRQAAFHLRKAMEAMERQK